MTTQHPCKTALPWRPVWCRLGKNAPEVLPSKTSGHREYMTRCNKYHLNLKCLKVNFSVEASAVVISRIRSRVGAPPLPAPRSLCSAPLSSAVLMREDLSRSFSRPRPQWESRDDSDARHAPVLSSLQPIQTLPTGPVWNILHIYNSPSALHLLNCTRVWFQHIWNKKLPQTGSFFVFSLHFFHEFGLSLSQNSYLSFLPNAPPASLALHVGIAGGSRPGGSREKVAQGIFHL